MSDVKNYHTKQVIYTYVLVLLHVVEVVEKLLTIPSGVDTRLKLLRREFTTKKTYSIIFSSRENSLLLISSSSSIVL